MIHAVKCEKVYFDEMFFGNKTFEIRKNDRNYKAGDYLGVNEWLPEKEKYTGRSLLFKITYILDNQEFLQKNYVALGIRQCIPSLKPIMGE